MSASPLNTFLASVLAGVAAGVLASLAPLAVPSVHVGTIPVARYWMFLPAALFITLLLGIGAALRFRSSASRDQALFFLLVASVFLSELKSGLLTLGFISTSAGLSLWALRGFASGRITVVTSPLYPPALALIGCIALSLLSPVAAFVGSFSKMISFAIFRVGYLFLLINAIQTGRQLRLVVDYVLVWCFVSGLMIVIQVVSFELFDVLILPPIAEEGVIAETTWWEWPRFRAFSDNAPELTVVFLVGTMLAGMECLDVRLRLWWVRRLWLLATAVLSIAGIILMAGKISAAALVMTWSLMVLWRWPRWGMGLVCVGVATVAVVMAIMDVQWPWEQGLVLWLLGEEREHLLTVGLEAMSRFPLTGTGFGIFDWNNALGDLSVHNSFLQVATEIGLPGLAVFLWLVGGVGWRLGTAVRQAPSHTWGNLLAALGWTYVALIVIHLVHPFATSKFFWLYLGIVEAAVLLATRGEDPRVSPRFGL